MLRSHVLRYDAAARAHGRESRRVPQPAKPETLYLVDGTSQLFRAYFAIRGLTNSEGLPTNAVYGFTTMLRKLIQDERPRYLGVAFDLPGDTFRHEEYAEYKANRPAAPEDLNVQVPYAKEVCEALHIPLLEQPGYEADDLIATLTREAREAGFDVVVVASDKDLLQLVGEGVAVLNPSKNVRLDASGVEQSFGVRPEHVLDVQGLMGDSVDNIPGVPGVGEKTAKTIVRTYGDLERVIERADRFSAVYDARDRLLEVLASMEREERLTEPTARRVAEEAATLAGELDRLLELEADDEFAARLRELRSALDEGVPADLAARAGERGRTVARQFQSLKKALKGMDRGSSKRVWYAIRDHAEQARLSRRLATLNDRAPAEFDPGALELGPADRERLQALFRRLGFRSLIADLVAAGEPGEPEKDSAVARRGDYRTILDRESLQSLVEDCRAAGTLALVAETDGKDPMRARLVGISLSHAEERAAYVPLGHDDAGAAGPLPPDTVSELLGPLLADGSVAKLGHDLKFASHVLRRHGMPLEGWELDTMVGAFLLNPGRTSYALDRLSEELLGYTPAPREDVAGSGGKQKSLELELGKLAEAAAERAEVTLRLAQRIDARLNEADLMKLYREMDGPLLPVLARMEQRGIRVDTELLAAMSEEMKVSLELARREIHELAGTEFNVDSPKQVREVLFERLGLKPRRKTAKSRVASTDAQTLEELAGEHEIARKLLEYRELAKLKGTYADALPQLVHPETGRVHTCYHPTGAATGRLSSSDPNLQNIPARTEAGRRIRGAFVPEPGCVFLASDYSQIELRVLAQLTEDPGLIQAFRDGEDIHRHTAASVAGVSPDLVTEEMRRRAKAVNFGLLYGMSETRLAREQGMSRTEARLFIRSYFERFRRVRDYIEQIREQARQEGAVRTLFGRVRYFPVLQQRVNRGLQEQALRGAVNTTIQGTAADLMKLAMLRVDEALAAAGCKSQILLQVHDELLLEVPESEVAPVQRLVRRAMEGVREMKVPLVVDQKLGSSWQEVT